MKKLIPEIKPKEGFGELRFGELSQHIIDVLGEPEEVENIQDDDEFNTTILNYEFLRVKSPRPARLLL